MANQMGDAGLAIGAGDADQLQLLFGMTMPDSGKACQRGTGVVTLPETDPFGQGLLGRILHQNGSSAQFQRLCDILMTVAAEAFDGDKQAASLDLAGVITRFTNGAVGRAGQMHGLHILQQFA